MGWNTGYTIMEAIVIGSYDLGKLDSDLLSVLLEPFAGKDMDRGGSLNLESHDGKTVEQIIIETWGLEMPPTPLGRVEDGAWDSYYDQVHDLLRKVMTEVD